MRSHLICSLLLSLFVTGCYCCPEYYGPGMNGYGGWTPSYSSCVETKHIPPPPGVIQRAHYNRKMSVVQRRQQRDLNRWYRELNGGGHHSKHCPHCHHSSEIISDCGCGGEWLDCGCHGAVCGGEYATCGEYSTCGEYLGCGAEFTNFGGGYPMMEGGYEGVYEGEIYQGEYPVEGYESYPAPSEAAPTPARSAPPMEPSPSGPSTTSMHRRPTSEYYYPPSTTSKLPPMPAPQPLYTESQSHVQPVSVDPSLFAPPIIE